MKVATVRIKTFQSADAATLDTDYEAWRETLGEEQLVDTRLTTDGTTLVLVVLYTRG